jgi:hypothetical protein
MAYCSRDCGGELRSERQGGDTYVCVKCGQRWRSFFRKWEGSRVAFVDQYGREVFEPTSGEGWEFDRIK